MQVYVCMHACLWFVLSSWFTICFSVHPQERQQICDCATHDQKDYRVLLRGGRHKSHGLQHCASIIKTVFACDKLCHAWLRGQVSEAACIPSQLNSSHGLRRLHLVAMLLSLKKLARKTWRQNHQNFKFALLSLFLSIIFARNYTTYIFSTEYSQSFSFIS